MESWKENNGCFYPGAMRECDACESQRQWEEEEMYCFKYGRGFMLERPPCVSPSPDPFTFRCTNS